MIEVVADQVEVVVVSDCVDQLTEFLLPSEHAVLDGVEDLSKGTTDVLVWVHVSHSFSESFDFSDSGAEDEFVFFSDFFADFDVGTVHGTEEDAAVHDELHVGSSGGFHTSCGDVLGDFGGGDDDHGAGDVVVGVEDDLEEFVDCGVVVDFFSNGVGELDDALGSEVAWGSLATDEAGSGEPDILAFLPGSLEDADISVDDV